MVPYSHLHIGGTEIRGDQILPDYIGDRTRVSKEQAWMSQGAFCSEKVHYFGKTFYCLSAGASKAYFEYNAKKLYYASAKVGKWHPGLRVDVPSRWFLRRESAFLGQRMKFFSV